MSDRKPLWYIGDVLVGVVTDCQCPPPPVPPGDGVYVTADHPHESHDIVPVRGEHELPEGVDFEDYKSWCRMFAAAPDLLEGCERSLDFVRHTLEFFGWSAFPNLEEGVRDLHNRLVAIIAKAKGLPQ